MFIGHIPGGIMFLSKKGKYYYVFFKNTNGKMTSRSTKTNKKSEAMKFLINLQRQITSRNDNPIIPIEVNKFLFEYLKYSERVHSWNHTLSLKTTFNEFNKIIKVSNLSEVSREVMDKFISERRKYVSPFSIRRDIANFSGAFEWGIKRNFLLVNYCKQLAKPKLPEILPLFYSNSDIEKLLKTIDDDDIRDIVLFALNTGLRQSEVITLEWSQINLTQNLITLDNRNRLTKSKKVRSIPLNKIALNVINNRSKNREHECVFTFLKNPIKQLTLSHKFKKYVKKSGINPKLNFHSLRHTFASRLVQKGASIYLVSKLLGHASVTTTQIYAHVNADDLRASVELLE